jgi:hypothetical protein
VKISPPAASNLRSPLQSTLNFVSDRQDIAENRRGIKELREMLQAIIDHLGVPYAPKDSTPKNKQAGTNR